MNRQVIVEETEDGKQTFLPLGKYWLSHPDRRQFDHIDFAPGVELPPEVYNLWRGFSYQPQEGSWQRMEDHVRRILAQGDEVAFNYIIRWAAWAVQNPGDPAEVALVFRGGKGTGKGTFCRWLKNLFGQHGLQIFSSKHISGRFNGHLRDCVLLFADEAIAPNDKDAESILKGMLTEPAIPIEGKGRDVIQAPNHLHVVMASNAEWVIPATADERRFAIFDVSDEALQIEGWFDLLYTEMENGGAEAMLYFLLNLDLDGWHPRDDIPANQALNDQRIRSLQGPDEIWLDWLWTGEPVGEQDGARVQIQTTTFAKMAGVKPKTAAMFLKEMGCTHDRKPRPTVWLPPPLPEARKIWNDRRFHVDWSGDINTWQGIPTPPDRPPF